MLFQEKSKFLLSKINYLVETELFFLKLKIQISPKVLFK